MKITNQITALFMGKTDFRTGRWFPFKKMTWSEKRSTNYLNLSISFIEGAKDFRVLYPKSTKVYAYGEVRNYRDISYCPWRDRLPISRPLEARYRLLYGFDLDREVDPIEYAAISGGYRFGDRNDLFPEVAPDEHDNYNFIFCSGDACYFSPKNKPEIEKIPVGVNVTIHPQEKEEIQKGEWEEDNSPPESIRMKMFAESQLVGYAPPYIKDLYRRFGEKLQVTTYRKNLGAAFDSQFVFKATINKSAGTPFSDIRYQPFNLHS